MIRLAKARILAKKQLLEQEMQAAATTAEAVPEPKQVIQPPVETTLSPVKPSKF